MAIWGVDVIFKKRALVVSFSMPAIDIFGFPSLLRSRRYSFSVWSPPRYEIPCAIRYISTLSPMLLLAQYSTHDGVAWSFVIVSSLSSPSVGHDISNLSSACHVMEHKNVSCPQMTSIMY